MPSDKVQSVLTTLDSFTVLEIAELSKALQEHWGVSAAAPVAMGASPAAGGASAGAAAAAPVEEKTEFDVILKEAGAQKIPVIKVVRELTGGTLGLKEAKDLVESAPAAIKKGVPKAEADEARKKLEEVGATVEIK